MIDFSPSVEQRSIVDSIISFLAREAPVSRLRERSEVGEADDARFMREIATLGWLGLGLSEDKGGVGYGLAEEMLLFQQAGRYLLSPSLFASVLGAHLAAKAEDSDLTTAILAGSARLGFLQPLKRSELGPISSGAFYSLDARRSDILVAIDDRGAIAVDAEAIVPCEEIRGLDEHVQLAKVQLDQVRVRAWVPSEVLALNLRATILTSAMLVGIAQAAADMAVDYSKLREQFGQPIGAFQAVKHICADMAVRCEAALSLLIFAVLALGDDRPDAAFQVAAAKIIAISASVANAEKNIQVHGGFGFTAECAANRYLRRAHLLAELGGNRRHQEVRLLAEPAPR